jgi:hypothetical protein
MLLDVKTKRLVRMKIPEESQAPSEGVSATVDREGTAFATVATGCSAALFSASRSLKWTKVRNFERDVPLVPLARKLASGFLWVQCGGHDQSGALGIQTTPRPPGEAAATHA